MHKFIITIIILLSSTSLAPAQCITRPSCEEMGYTQSASDCANKKSLRCPFDMTAYLCAELGTCDFSAYPLTSCPTGGNCSNITCDGTTKYKLNSCNSGYTQSGNTCNLDCNFTNYPLSSCPTGGNCSNYSCGGTTKYKLNSCQSGYEQSGNTCTACSFSGYSLSSCPSNGNCTSKTCGGTTKYKLNSCKSGYTKSGNTCVYDPCSGYYECGGSWQYCEGYTCSADSSMCSEYCVDDYFPYECDSEDLCDDAWGVYRDGYCSEECEAECDFSGYSLSDCPYNGNCSSITCGNETRYKLNSCSSGYEKWNNRCVACSNTYTDCDEFCSYNLPDACYKGATLCVCF